MEQLNNAKRNLQEIHDNSTGGTTVRKCLVDEVVIYEVKESELDELERGSQSDLYLEFAIACISIFVSFLIAIITVTFPKDSIIEIVFICVDIIMAIAGSLFCFLWYRQRKDRFKVILAIRQRKRE